MYIIVGSKRFQKQLRRLKKVHPSLLKKLEAVIEILHQGKSLPLAKQDHKLTGQLNDYRECHVAPDWLLIYKRHEDILVLELLSTGTHSTLFE